MCEDWKNVKLKIINLFNFSTLTQNQRLLANILTTLSYFILYSVFSFLLHGVEKQQLVSLQEPSRAMMHIRIQNALR